jgi:putative ABC transport system permease protein
MANMRSAKADMIARKLLRALSPVKRITEAREDYLMRFVYAYRNLLHARGLLFVSLLGIGFAAFLMTVQGSLIYGFTRAASRVVDALDADLVIVAPGISAFEFVAPIEERIARIATGVEGVASAGRGLAGWAPFEKPSGKRTNVFLVAVDEEFLGRMPDTRYSGSMHGLGDSMLVIDESDREITDGAGLPAHVQVSGRRAVVAGTVEGFSTFLGAAMVFADIPDARRYLRYPGTMVSFIPVRVKESADKEAVRNALRKRFTEVEAWTIGEFSWRSRVYWLIKTGAGAALSLAAVLGFAIGLSVIGQTIYGLTAERVEEFATLKATGATDEYIRSVVLLQAIICGVVGGTAGLGAIRPFVALARDLVSWIVVPGWMYFVVILATGLLCVLGALIAVRPALSVEPGRVFRA